jgi:hypothetical protein
MANLPLVGAYQTTLVIFELKRHLCFSRFVLKYIRSGFMHIPSLPSISIPLIFMDRLRRELSQAV